MEENIIDIISDIQKIKTSLYKIKQECKVSDIKINDFQNVLINYNKLNKFQKNLQKDHIEEIEALNDTIFSLLHDPDIDFECLMLASKVYFAGLILIDDIPKAFVKCINVLKFNEQSGLNGVSCDRILLNKIVERLNVCYCFALLELNVIVWTYHDNHFINDILLNLIYPICEKVSSKYTCVTLLAFRCLTKIFNLLHYFNKTGYILPFDFVSRTMNIVMSNWENPLTGVRDENSSLFYNFLLLTNNMQWVNSVFIDKEYFGSNINQGNVLLYLVLTQQSWMMKSKFFVLSEILRNRNVYELLLPYKEDLFAGFRISLLYPYLRSAGCDLYRSCSLSLSASEWKEIFLPFILEILLDDKNDYLKQNLTDYWMNTALTKCKGIYDTIYDEVNNQETANLTSFIALSKIGRKDGMIDWGINNGFKTDKSLNKLKMCLIHSDEVIRSDAFYSLCISKILNKIPTRVEIELIKEFLMDNVNYDSPRLRNNILSSCTVLFVRFRDSLLMKIKEHKGLPDHFDDHMSIALEFMSWFYQFLMSNLDDGCNYQRKYISISLYSLVLNYLGDCKIKVLHQRKSNNNISGYKFKEFAEKFDKWKFTSKESRKKLFSCILDPSDTIRDLAASILINNFSFDNSDSEEINLLFRRGMELISDKYFYLAESGAVLLETVTTLVYKKYGDNSDISVLNGLVSGQPNILSKLLNIAEKQKLELFADILKAAYCGSPLHGVLNVITKLLTNHQSPEFGILTTVQMKTLINILESVVRKLVDAFSTGENDTDFAPSFAEMTKSIENMAQKSALYNDPSIDNFHSITPKPNNCAEDDNICEHKDVQLTTSHQLILNCIWLNIKVSCSLAENLITSSLLDSNLNHVNRCVNVIIYVLQKCRHKGAIESAGVSIMSVTKALTRHENKIFQVIPERVLNDTFENLINSKGGTVSRRSAGLSILVHRIIIGDSNQKKPLLHSSLLKLINSASQNVDVSDLVELQDLPQSRAIHLMSRLVEDATLRQEIAFHINQIAVLCFSSLNSNVWTVRNAALQLFGALVPKLIGQKKHQDDEDRENYAIPIEELHFHMRDLFELIEKQLSACFKKRNFEEDSNFVPTLVLLSNTTVTLHAVLNQNLRKSCLNLMLCTECLFSSNIHHVRNLAATINCNLHLPCELKDLILHRVDQIVMELKVKCWTRNQLHGYMLSLKCLVSKFFKLKTNIFYLNRFTEEISFSLKKLNEISYSINIPGFMNSILSDILVYINDINILERKERFLCSIDYVTKGINVGFSMWCFSEIRLLMLNCNSNELVNLVEIFLKHQNEDVISGCLKSLEVSLNQTKIDNNATKSIFQILVDYILVETKIQLLQTSFKVILSILEQKKLNLDVTNNFDDLKNKSVYNKFLTSMDFHYRHGSKCAGFSLPVISALLNKYSSSNFVMKVVNIIYEWSSPDEYNEEFRLSSVNSLIRLAPYLKLNVHNNDIGINIWKTLCNFLQDEDIDIRKRITIFFVEFYHNKLDSNLDSINPYVALRFLFKIDFMSHLMTEKSAVVCLWKSFDTNENYTCKFIKSIHNLNPYDQGLKNIYKEDVIIVNFIFDELIAVASDIRYKNHLNELIEGKPWRNGKISNCCKDQETCLVRRISQYKDLILSRCKQTIN